MIKRIALALMLMMTLYRPVAAEWRVTPSLGIRRDNFSSAGLRIRVGSFEGRVAAEHFKPCGGLWVGGEAGGGGIVDAAQRLDGGVFDLEIGCGRMICPYNQPAVRLIPSLGFSYHGLWLKDKNGAHSLLKLRSAINLGTVFGGVETRFIRSCFELRVIAQLQAGLLHDSSSIRLRAVPYYEVCEHTHAGALGGALKFEGSYRIGKCYALTLEGYVRDYWIGKSVGTVTGTDEIGDFEGSIDSGNGGQWWTWGIGIGLKRKF